MQDYLLNSNAAPAQHMRHTNVHKLEHSLLDGHEQPRHHLCSPMLRVFRNLAGDHGLRTKKAFNMAA